MDVPELHDMEMSQAFAAHIGVVRRMILVLLKAPQIWLGRLHPAMLGCYTSVRKVYRCVWILGTVRERGSIRSSTKVGRTAGLARLVNS